MNHLNSPLTLPNGTVIKNRIAKSAMSENIANKDHSPSDRLIRVYERWGKGGAGLLITGNVMIDINALGEAGNVVVEDERHLEAFRRWANTAKGTDTHIWPQINHPGRQSMGSINKEVVAPSAVGVKIKGAGFMFSEPRALTEDEILDLIHRFGTAAAVFQKAGFTGVQIHGAHGYLVSQFLSPLSNIREDKWGGRLENRARFVIEIYKEMRRRVGPKFPIGIKINSADFQRGGFTEEESMEVVNILASEGMDLIEISGGTYEKAAMMGAAKKESTRQREAYFMDYIEKVRKITDKPLMLTGGFRTASVMEAAVADGILDLVGIARPFTLYPDLPNRILSGDLEHLDLPFPKTGIKMIDSMGFLDLLWHELHIKRLGDGKKPNPGLSPYAALGHSLSLVAKKLLPFGRSSSRGF